MKPDSIIKIIIAVLAIALIAITVHCCRDTWHASPAAQTTGTKTTVTIKPGIPDTAITKHPVHGTAALAPISKTSNFGLRTSDSTDTTHSWFGTLHLGKDSVSVTATIDTAGTLNLEYSGSLTETVISKVDSVFSNTVVTQTEKTPWYETPIAVITGTVVVLIGITAIIFKVL